MVEEHNQDISNSKSISTTDIKSGELFKWIRTLQQVLTVEVDHGFTNIEGRTDKFSCFVGRYLLTCPFEDVQECDIYKLKQIASNYESYPSMSTDDRRRIIVNTRQTLYNLSRILMLSFLQSHLHLVFVHQKLSQVSLRTFS